MGVLSEAIGVILDAIEEYPWGPRRRAARRASGGIDAWRRAESLLEELGRLRQPRAGIVIGHPAGDYEEEVEAGEARIVIKAHESVAREAAARAARLAPAVAELAGARGVYEVEVSEGVLVENGREYMAATNPDTRPARILVHPRWRELSDSEKDRVIAHELAHALGVKSEEEADKIARVVTGVNTP